MKNKLISDEYRKRYLHNMGRPYPEERCSGKSTGYALRVLGKVMTNPGKRWDVRVDFNTYQVAVWHFKLVRSLSQQLGLHHLNFDKARLHITYEVFDYAE